jgi:PAS domain S-box-containing protein
MESNEQDLNPRISWQRDIQSINKRLELIFNSSFQLNILLDLQGNILNVNDRVLKMRNYRKEDIVGHPLLDLFMEEESAGNRIIIQDALQRAAQGGRSNFEIQLVLEEKEILEVSVRPIYDSSDIIQFLLMEAKDITKKKWAIAQLHERQKRFEGVFDSSFQFTTLIALDGKVIDVNRAILETFGYNKELLVGLWFWDLPFIEGDKESAIIAEEVVRHTANGKEFNFEIVVLHNDQEVIAENWYRPVKDENGNVMFIVAEAKNITARTKAEREVMKLSQYYRILIQGSSHAIMSTRASDNMITTFNKASELMFGYKAEEVVGKCTPLIFLDPDEVKTVVTKVSDSLGVSFNPDLGLVINKVKDGVSTMDVNEWTAVRKDGSRFAIEVSIGSLLDQENQITGFVLIGKDISERKKTEMEIRRAKAEAEMANKAKSEFLANMSHEIRTPMNGVIGFSDLLLKTKLDRDQQQFARIINQSAHDLLEIINDVLDFSKIEAGKLELHIERCDVQTLTSMVSNSLSFLANNKGLEMVVNLAPDLPKFIWVDELRLRQVFINLLGNAIKFTEKGIVELKMELIPDAQNPNGKSKGKSKQKVNLLCSVSDTGIGIREESRKKIFDAFTQEDSTTSRTYGGTGLGLSISNKLLKLMDSNLQVKSEVGQGSTFYFELQVPAEFSDPKAVALQGKEERINMEVVLSHSDEIKILIADDNRVNLDLLRILLLEKMPNAKIVVANNGMKAVDQFGETRFDLVLLDVQMPELDGLDAAKRMRAIEAGKLAKSTVKLSGTSNVIPTQALDVRIPIIGLSASNMKGDLDKCLVAGMDDFLGKPIIPESLSKLLAKWLLPSTNGHAAAPPQMPSEAKDVAVIHFDHAALQSRFKNKEVFLKQLLTTSLEELDESIEKLQQLHSERNFSSLQKTAHHLKGTALAVCFTDLAALCRQLEHTTEENEAELTKRLKEVEMEIEIVKQLVGKIINP